MQARLTRRLPLIEAAMLLAAVAASFCGVAVASQPARPVAAASDTLAPPAQMKLPLDNVAAGVVAWAWGSQRDSGEAKAPTPPSDMTPASLFANVLASMLAEASGEVTIANWVGKTVLTVVPPKTEELWPYRLLAHRAAAAGAFPAQPGLVPMGSTIAEGLVLVNLMRKQAPEALDTGPEGRVLRVLNFINTRSVYIAAVASPTAIAAASGTPLANTSLVRLVISWSSRSEPMERCRAIVIGEAAVSASDWPADLIPGPWLLALKPGAYYGALGSGLGNYLRYAVALHTAAKPGAGRGPESPATAISASANELAGTVSRNVERTIFLTQLRGVATLVFACRGADEASAAQTAAAGLLGLTADQPTPTAWGSVKLVRLGQRSIGLELSAAP